MMPPSFRPVSPRREPGRRRRLPALLVLAVAALVLGVGVETVRRAAFERMPRTDLTVYLAGAGSVLRGGADLYTATDVHGWHYTLPPLFAICAVPLALLPIGAAAALWYAITVGLLALSLVLLVRMVTPAGATRSARVLVVPLLLCADPLLGTVTRGQLGVAMLALCVVAVECHRRGRPFLSGLVVALAATTKVYTGLLVLYFVARKDRRALLGCLAGFAAFGVALPAAVLGPRTAVSLWSTWLRDVVLPYGRPYGSALPYRELQNQMISKNQSIYATLSHAASMLRAGPLDSGDSWVKVVVAAATVALLVWAWRGWRRSARQSGPFRTLLDVSVAAVLGLVLVPTAWTHYFVLLLLPLAVACGHLRHGPPGAARDLLRRSVLAVSVLSGTYTLTSIVRPVVDATSVWNRVVTLLESAGLFCWATLVLSVAFLRVPNSATDIAQSAPSAPSDPADVRAHAADQDDPPPTAA